MISFKTTYPYGGIWFGIEFILKLIGDKNFPVNKGILCVICYLMIFIKHKLFLLLVVILYLCHIKIFKAFCDLC